MSVVHVRLENAEVAQGALVGVFRQVQNLRDGRRDAHGASPWDGWQLHIEGCLGEMAFAKFVGSYWSGAHRFRAKDVGDYEIRTARSDGRRLILHKEDPDDHVFVFLTGQNGAYRIQGWIFGRDGKQPSFWEDPKGTGRHAYFVPTPILRPIEELVTGLGQAVCEDPT